MVRSRSQHSLHNLSSTIPSIHPSTIFIIQSHQSEALLIPNTVSNQNKSTSSQTTRSLSEIPILSSSITMTLTMSLTDVYMPPHKLRMQYGLAPTEGTTFPEDHEKPKKSKKNAKRRMHARNVAKKGKVVTGTGAPVQAEINKQSPTGNSEPSSKLSRLNTCLTC